jgi:hypothetical protein
MTSFSVCSNCCSFEAIISFILLTYSAWANPFLLSASYGPSFNLSTCSLRAAFYLSKRANTPCFS